MKASDLQKLALRITELLRINPDSESTIELQLLRDGSVRVLRLEEDTQK